jgi:hypothetical protein
LAVLLVLAAACFAPRSEAQVRDDQRSEIDAQNDRLKRGFDVAIAGYESSAKERHELWQAHHEKLTRLVSRQDPSREIGKVCADSDAFLPAGTEVWLRYKRLGKQLTAAIDSDTASLKSAEPEALRSWAGYMRWSDAKARRSMESELGAIWRESIQAAYVLAQNQCLAAELGDLTDEESKKLHGGLTEQLEAEKFRIDALTKMLQVVVSSP